MQVPDKQLKSIVLVGKFNPSIFQPAWFVAHGLIGENDGASVEVNIIHPDVVNFRLNWCNVEVTRERVVVTTTQDQAFELIRDLMVGTFRLLSHTPIEMLGINTEMHFRMNSAEEWHKFGHQLAPKEQFWADTILDPGTANVAILGRRPDQYIGKIQVEVRPADRIPNGVIFRINDHYEVADKSNVIGCKQIIDILETEWEISHGRAVKIIDNALIKIER